MAQALSFVGPGPGVVLLAGGPELTNAVTGIAQAYYAKTPLVVISGSNTYSKRDKGFPQDMDQLQVMRPFTKWARSYHDVHRIPEYVAMAFRHAVCGCPGPVYLEVPYDVMETAINSEEVVIPAKPVVLRPGADLKAVQALAALLRQAERPVAVVDSGAFRSGAREELQKFVERTAVPLLLSDAAMAMPFSAEAVMGVGGLGVSRPWLEAITAADVILLLGARLNYAPGFGQPLFISDRQKIIQIDIEPEEMDGSGRVDLRIAADLRTGLRALNSLPLHPPATDS